MNKSLFEQIAETIVDDLETIHNVDGVPADVAFATGSTVIGTYSGSMLWNNVNHWISQDLKAVMTVSAGVLTFTYTPGDGSSLTQVYTWSGTAFVAGALGTYITAASVHGTLTAAPALTDDTYFTPLVRRYGQAKTPTSKTLDRENSRAFIVEIEVMQSRTGTAQPKLGGKQDFFMHFEVYGYLMNPENSGVASDTILNDVYAGIVTALMLNPQRIPDGSAQPLAIDTVVGDMDIFQSSQGDFEGVKIPVTVRVRTKQFDPYHL